MSGWSWRSSILAALLSLVFTTSGTARAMQSVFPLFLDGAPLADLPVKVEGSRVELDSRALLAALRGRISPEAERELQLASRGPWVALAALEAAGIHARYDEARLELRLELAPLARPIDEIALQGREAPEWQRKIALAPDPLSAFLNVNAGQDFAYGASSPQLRQPLRTELGGAVNARGWVVEGAGSYNEGAPLSWTRGDFRLVRDQPGSMIRYQAGDILYSVSGFQQFRPLAGIAATTDFSLQPYRLTTPLNRHELLLKSRSTVKVYMNGRLLKTLDLPAGRHDIRDLPVSAGVNDVRLEITDDVGRTETVRVPYVYSDQLLAEGTQQLAYAIGAPATVDAGGARGYDSAHPTATLSHRVGLSDAFTLGAYAQGESRQAVGGASLVAASTIGTWNLESAASRVFDTGASGAGLRLAYLYTDYGGPAGTQRNLGLSVEGRGSSFATLGTLVPPGFFSAAWNASFSQQLYFAGTFTLTASTAPGIHAVSAGLARDWSGWARGMDTSLTVTGARDVGGNHSVTALFFLTWAFPESRQTISASASQDLQRTEWSYNPSSNLAGGGSVSASVQRSDGDRRLDAKADYSGNRATASLVHETDANDATGTASRTGARAGFALLYAGGHAAIGRPVVDSFALVAREGGLASTELLINPQGDDGREASADGFGPGAATQLPAYRYSQVRLSAPDAPPGATLPQETYVLFPTYKSGKALEAGSKGFILARGKLLARAGAPEPLWSGEARALDDASFPPVTLFTNREGEFAVEGLQPGRYEARPFDDRRAPFRFEIPERPPGILDIGEVRTP